MLMKLLNCYAGIILGVTAYGGWIVFGAVTLIGPPLLSIVLWLLLVSAFVALACAAQMENDA